MNTETYDFEDRKYINPTVSRDEQLGFIDNLRNAQQQGMDQIVSETHNLGTDVPSSVGGLNGATGMWQSQYMTPKMNTMVSSMRATAQAQALSDILSNYQNQMKQRYNEAYRAYQLKDAQNKSGSNSNSSSDDNDVNVKTKSDGSSEPYELEKVTDENMTDDDIDPQIAALEGELNPLLNTYNDTIKRENIDGNGQNIFGYAGVPFTKWGIINEQADRLKRIKELQSKINDLKNKKGK